MEYCDLWTEQTQIFCKMVKQRRLLTSIAIFTALYMTAALGWWTYSLLQYNVAESKLQLELLENKKLLQSIIDNTSNPIFIKGINGQYLFISVALLLNIYYFFKKIKC